MSAIHPRRVNHLNMVVADFDAARRHFEAMFGAQFLADLPQAEWHAGLLAIGGVIFELFAPHAFLLNARYGPHYLGIEYQADMRDVRAAIESHGIRIARDIGAALHTDPVDTLGIAFEFYDGSFHDRRWPLLGGAAMRDATWWRDAHPLGLLGLTTVTVAVRDLAAAGAFLASFLDARLVHADPCSATFRIADSDVELLAADGDGIVRRQLDRYGEGILSVVFAARDLDRVGNYFADRGVALVAGIAPGRLALPPAHNLDLLFEFAA